MMSVMQKRQEHGGKARVPLFPCFIDLHKVYESTDHDLFWVGTCSIWIAIKDYSNNPQFHNGMVACVGNNSGIYSEGFDVQHGLLQGCVLFPWLLKLIFMAIFLVS